jgi:hypothetical protein
MPEPHVEKFGERPIRETVTVRETIREHLQPGCVPLVEGERPIERRGGTLSPREERGLRPLVAAPIRTPPQGDTAVNKPKQ